MKNKVLHFSIFLIFVLMASCTDKDHVVEGMQPVYFSYDDFSEIKTLPKKEIITKGKTIAKGNYLFINDKKLGIHVYDISDPLNYTYLYFWQIYGNTEFIIIDNVLYADNGKHLLVIDISDFGEIKLLDVFKDQFEPLYQDEYPQNYDGWFECIRPDVGILLRWEKATLVNPNCKTT